ncbi:ExbD/TolR family protein [Peredibacter starrii]|uniref:Biopolymer transporter ExbD n=1 Tax=Peredibacter starrii TaxID=28202 RepID=A0AAX4HV64_9BACT|nr:biopolymer transporter ExbD [Peredibacter starrii]WPU67070.1 biopolymer transporter ExbD [Peredibacter starrii]
MKVGHKIKKPEKLNLVPILDSVFIFIFFLLMSAQFVDVYEIGSSVPMTKEAKDEKQEKDPLNLTLEISKEQIVVKTGLRNPRSRTFASEQKTEMKDYLAELKRQNPKENTMILKTDPKVPFQTLITVIDSTKENKEAKDMLFPQIVFDNNGVK